MNKGKWKNYTDYLLIFNVHTECNILYLQIWTKDWWDPKKDHTVSLSSYIPVSVKVVSLRRKQTNSLVQRLYLKKLPFLDVGFTNC